MTRKTKIVLSLLACMVILALAPLFLLPNAEFGGSDDAGSEAINEVLGREYQPWATPLLEKLLGHELPGETESLLFCVQTGIGVGILAFSFGYLVARKKYTPEAQADVSPTQSMVHE